MNTWKYLIPVSVCMQVCASAAYAVQYLSVEEAQRISFPSAEVFEQNAVILSEVQKEKISSLSGVRVRNNEQKVWIARETTGTILGYFIIDEVYGKHEFITYGVALTVDGVVDRIEVLDYRETYGGEINNTAWREQFVGKKYGDKLTLEEDIKNISGATLSCKHITEGVKRLLAFYETVFNSQT